MLFHFDERPSNSPFVERVWSARSVRAGRFLSVAASQWEIVISRYQGQQTVTVRGPETRPTPLWVTQVGATFTGIIFKYGALMPHLPISGLVDGDANLPDASGRSFWLDGFAWPYPTFENADTFVDRLARAGILTFDPVVASTLRGEPLDLSMRSIQRHFLRATGLTHSAIRKIERARYASILLRAGVSIQDTVAQAGYTDQPHLTRSLRALMGRTPDQLLRGIGEMSLLYNTTLFP